MTIKKCKYCKSEDDFTDGSVCDTCAVEMYCKIYRDRVLELIDDEDLKSKIKDLQLYEDA